MRNLAARCTLGGKGHGQGPNRQLLGPLQARSVFAVGSCRDRTDSQNVIYRGLSTPLPECQCSLQRYSGESGNRDDVRCVKGVGWKKRGKLKKKKKTKSTIGSPSVHIFGLGRYMYQQVEEGEAQLTTSLHYQRRQLCVRAQEELCGAGGSASASAETVDCVHSSASAHPFPISLSTN